jgi:hypothetical protein
VSCNTEKTIRGTVDVSLKLASEGKPCDRDVFIPDGSVLKATGEILRLTGGIACFEGKFSITTPDEKFFEGTIVTFDRLGTHHAPAVTGTEACDQKNHVEGYLKGDGVGRLTNRFKIQALIVAKAVLPTATGRVDILANLDGTIIEECP